MFEKIRYKLGKRLEEIAKDVQEPPTPRRSTADHLNVLTHLLNSVAADRPPPTLADDIATQFNRINLKLDELRQLLTVQEDRK